jgi:Pathogenicity locus
MNSSTLTTRYESLRRAVPRDALRPLLVIPGIGPSLAADLCLLGIRKVESLEGRDPEALYRKLQKLVGRPVDRCVLYTFRCAVYFASESKPDPAKLKWWLWMDEPDATKAKRPRPHRQAGRAPTNR